MFISGEFYSGRCMLGICITPAPFAEHTWMRRMARLFEVRHRFLPEWLRSVEWT